MNGVSLLKANEVQTNDRFALQNGKMLKATLGPASGMTEFFARAGAMVAYQGGVSFDGHWQGFAAQYQRYFSQGEGLNLMKVSGSGTVFLANQASDVHILDLTNGDSFTVDGKNVLAFEKALNWNIIRVESQVGIAGAGNYQVELSGTGKVAITTSGAPLVMRVDPRNYYFADADAVIGWSTSLSVSMQAAVTSSSVWRPRGNTGESWQLQFSGDGYVVVQPCELMPPYDAIEGGLGAAFGMGASGFAQNSLGGSRPHGSSGSNPLGGFGGLGGFLGGGR